MLSWYPLIKISEILRLYQAKCCSEISYDIFMNSLYLKFDSKKSKYAIICDNRIVELVHKRLGRYEKITILSNDIGLLESAICSV